MKSEQTVKLILAGFFFLAIFLLCVAFVNCQTKIVAPPYISHEAHKDLEDLEEDIRIKSIFVISVEPIAIFWKKESRDKVDVGTFTYDSRSQVRLVDKTCQIAIYCSVHNYVYALYPCKGG